MCAKSLLEPGSTAHRRLCPEEPDGFAAGGDGRLSSRVRDVEDGQLREAAPHLRHRHVRRVGADHQALGACADEPRDAVFDEVSDDAVVVVFSEQVDVGVALSGDNSLFCETTTTNIWIVTSRRRQARVSRFSAYVGKTWMAFWLPPSH